jgi:hypothetical protein
LKMISSSGMLGLRASAGSSGELMMRSMEGCTNACASPLCEEMVAIWLNSTSCSEAEKAKAEAGVGAGKAMGRG